MRGTFIFSTIMLLACAGSARADVIEHIPTNDKVVALTFDACEAGKPVSFDQGVLRFLLMKQLPFTVFASGRFVESNKDDVAALASLDFVDIENHSWNHPNNMDTFDPQAVLKQVERADELIAETTGRTPQFFRFPAGNYNARGLKAVEDRGYKVVHWRWATGDPDPHESANALYKRVVRNVQPGDILIFHINGRGVHTGEALPRIVEYLEGEGYRFVLLSDYIGRPHPHQPEPMAETMVASARRALDKWLTSLPLLGSAGTIN